MSALSALSALSTLPAIAALVRAGAVGRAGALFAAGGHAARLDDPAALAVQGRLLKAQARLTAGSERAALLAAAAEAYGAAHALAPAPYLAINAASLWLQAGNPAEARRIAGKVLALLDAPVPPADTPYFLAATRAEALVLLGDTTGAQQALTAAVQCDPDGWDDRAATLAQLREVIAAQGGSAEWLAPFAPPACLHFAGHLGLTAGGSSEAELAVAVAAFLQAQPIGFAWGALAAGCDLVIAEALLASGAELHAVLPCPAELFAAQSVAPAGPAWLARYHTVLARCASLQVAGQAAATVHDPLATAFAGELAIGGALLGARRYGTAVHQLIVLDEAGGGANTVRQAGLWRAALGPQHRLTARRDAAVEALFPPEVPDPARQLALHVAIGIDGLRSPDTLSSAVIAALSAPVAAALDGLPAGLVRAQPGLWEFACTDPVAGLAAIAAVLAQCQSSGSEPPAIGVHLGIAPLLSDAASGRLLAYGPAPALARRLMDHAPAGVALASDALAVTLAARGERAARTELYLPDEPALGGAAHLLLPPAQ